jgi:hypothetical protein
MEKTIPLKGLNLSFSADDVADGYMEDVSGAHFANGTLRPVLPPIEEAEIATGRKVVYIHKVQGKEHAVSYDGAKLYFEYVRVGGVVTLNGAIILTPINDLIKVDSVGNMLVVLRTSGVHYILLKGSYAAPEYFSLGTKPPFPVVTFSAVREYVTNDNLTQVDIQPLENIPAATLNPANVTRVTTHVTGIINKLISEKRSAGLFVGAFFVRYAVRLFDDSLAYHSSPILIKGRFQMFPRCGNTKFNDTPNQILETTKLFGKDQDAEIIKYVKDDLPSLMVPGNTDTELLRSVFSILGLFLTSNQLMSVHVQKENKI